MFYDWASFPKWIRDFGGGWEEQEEYKELFHNWIQFPPKEHVYLGGSSRGCPAHSYTFWKSLTPPPPHTHTLGSRWNKEWIRSSSSSVTQRISVPGVKYYEDWILGTPSPLLKNLSWDRIGKMTLRQEKKKSEMDDFTELHVAFFRSGPENSLQTN